MAIEPENRFGLPDFSWGRRAAPFVPCTEIGSSALSVQVDRVDMLGLCGNRLIL